LEGEAVPTGSARWRLDHMVATRGGDIGGGGGSDWIRVVETGSHGGYGHEWAEFGGRSEEA
jgi:hypothetical protein